jgi:hypothetical protein
MKNLSHLLLTTLLFVGCGSSTSPTDNNPAIPDDGTKYSLNYKGLRFYAKDLPASHYKLAQVDDAYFNSLSDEKKLYVADKLLSTLFFGYPLPILKEKIASGTFISSLQAQLKEQQNDTAQIESYIQNSDFFFHAGYANEEVINILARFYAMENLDAYYLNNWSAYILTQTIMFSPAYELESSHEPNTERVYNALVRHLQEETTISYSTYLHMISSDNWRRFRSPEDNGREMMEIYALIFDDSKVPLAGKALQNWKLDRDHDTLVIGLNENTTPLPLFHTTIYNGDDFYRELAKSKDFQKGVTSRLVDFFFTNTTQRDKDSIIHDILKSNPQNWHDTLLQILFSKHYLLDTNRAKSAEETFYSLAKKMEYKHYKNSFRSFSSALEEMHQASMKYKLGKLKRVPLDTLSFINYHKFIRERLLLRFCDVKKEHNYTDYNAYGWRQHYISDSQFEIDEESAKQTLDAFVTYLFESTIARKPHREELALFEKHMLQGDGYQNGFNLLKKESEGALEKYPERTNAALLILDYISRLSELYTFSKVSS